MLNSIILYTLPIKLVKMYEIQQFWKTKPCTSVSLQLNCTDHLRHPSFRNWRQRSGSYCANLMS